MLRQEVIGALTALATADDPSEVERCSRRLAQLGVDQASLEPLVDALAAKTMRIRALERLSAEDSLTGLANRRSFHGALGRELARRHPRRGPAVILLDLDGLKQINDRLGHAAGDRAIERTGRACVAAVRRGDLVARLGGDELAVLLPDADAEGAHRVAERIRAAIAREKVGGTPLGASLGVAVAGPDGHDGASLLERADARMYEDKRLRKAGVSRLVA